MSYGVGLRNGVAFALGTIPSLTSGGGLRPSLMLDFLSGSLDPRITFSRGTQAMQYGSDGTLQYAPNNLLTYSNQADNAAWTKSNSFVQTNLLTFSDAAVANYTGISAQVVNTSPISGFTNSVAFPYTPATNIIAYKSYTTVAGIIYTISAYVQMDDGGVPVVTTSPTAGDFTLVTENNPTPTNITVTSVGGGVYRVYASITALGGGTNTGVVKYNTQSARGFKVTGLQLVQGSVPGDYVATTSAALPVLYADYNGALRARKLCDAATTGTHGVTQTTTNPNGTYTFSVICKPGERGYVYLDMSDNTTGDAAVQINISAGTYSSNAVTGSWTNPSASVTSLGNGWYRCSLTATRNAGTQTVSYIYISSSSGPTYTGDGSSGIYIADAQLTPGYLPLAVTETTSAAVYGPRFDYDPVTKVARGLLIEEQRTNLALWSAQIDNATWIKTNLTVTADAITAPDGSLSADKLVESVTTSVQHVVLQNITTTAVAHTFSIYAKAAERTWMFLQCDNPAAGQYFDLANGVLGSATGSGGTSTITSVGNGWYRCTLSFTALAATPAFYVMPATANNTSLYVGTVGSGIYAWGSQVEAGAFATSYIPTVGSTATRNADSASITTLTPWFNAAAGTMFASFDVIAAANGGGMAIASLDNNTVNGYLLYKGVSTATMSAYAGANNASIGSVTANVVAKAAVAYDGTNNAGTLNGAAPSAIVAAAVTTPTQLEIGRTFAGNQLSGHIQSIRYYPTRLANASLQSITV